MVGSGRQHLAVKWLGFGQTAGLVVVQGKLELLLEGRGQTLGVAGFGTASSLGGAGDGS